MASRSGPTTRSVTANRSALVSLAQNNIFGQNTPAIAVVESDQGEMWVHDVVAMDGYAASAAARPSATAPPLPAAAGRVSVPGLPEGLPPAVVANLAATLAAIPGATIIVVPPDPND